MTKRKHWGLGAFDPAKFFIWLVGVSALIYLTVSAIVGNGKFADIFFLRCADFFMDFFNSSIICFPPNILIVFVYG